MRLPLRNVLLAATLILSSVPTPRAQTGVDPSGHWEGTIQVPGTEASVEVDLIMTGAGELAGTIGTPSQNMRGLPLAKLAIDGRSLTFFAREDQPFHAVLSADGRSMSGAYAIGGYSIPFTLTRTGDARIEAAPKIASIEKKLEGTWNGTVAVNGSQLRLILRMSNRPDNTASGSLINLSEGGLEIPASAIAQAASNVRLDFKILGASYSAALSKDGSELVGTYSQGSVVLPVTFRRGEVVDGK
jgi:hypothetical protein